MLDNLEDSQKSQSLQNSGVVARHIPHKKSNFDSAQLEINVRDGRSTPLTVLPFSDSTLLAHSAIAPQQAMPAV